LISYRLHPTGGAPTSRDNFGPVGQAMKFGQIIALGDIAHA
jgi:hypothetical protein